MSTPSDLGCAQVVASEGRLPISSPTCVCSVFGGTCLVIGDRRVVCWLSPTAQNALAQRHKSLLTSTSSTSQSHSLPPPCAAGRPHSLPRQRIAISPFPATATRLFVREFPWCFHNAANGNNLSAAPMALSSSIAPIAGPETPRAGHRCGVKSVSQARRPRKARS